MKKADLAELARLGVRTKLEAIQAYLVDVFDDFPEQFSGDHPPVFLRPQEKPGGNSWPSDAHTVINSNGTGADAVLVKPTWQKLTWTPERRAAQAQRAKRQSAEKRRTGKWGELGWQRVHDLLKKAPDRTLPQSVIAKQLKMPETSVRSAFDSHEDVFKRVGRGLYQLTHVINKPLTKKAPAVRKGHKKKAAPKRWGIFGWQRIYDYIDKQDNRTAALSAIMKAAKVNSAASAITCMDSHDDLFKRVGPGLYALTKELTDEQRQ
jgi:hypothetical protein